MDDERFVAFYTRHYRLILTVAHQRLGGLGDAEDVTAEVFRIAWAHHAGGHDLTLAWVYATLRNVVGNEYRRRGRVTALVDKLGPMQDLAAAPVAVDDQLTVHAAMEALAEPDRDLLRMAYWEDLSAPEIAQILGCTPTAVRIRLTRARGRLKKQLSIDDPEEEVRLHGRPVR
ncbi:RNA polymerase, sigma-24 subunit, ECF subfamily [Xylanimonas cellulosilytica DSM 15894]|uniref:RNA polymerase, sigma-24 subunit, ECF subfamily n=1 Tax=Xylanimonas cellulosilytica (strain DSM 15894 / JCM 12276 / CECT 5975 / KCTC 9989 / LMG 20990 / NBRC 107835 / XIL07) TaxID=446471 RepID=D1BY52_XYLCX|nr:sigma-70 family RNA polymerase sigma factor [Xylanimonas cellulosilytica]ACZ29895.1 RNA polymerase, sigma-24 subunit, ECF subfamily [Xylanimonas cellulosilytica DSM 15894]